MESRQVNLSLFPPSFDTGSFVSIEDADASLGIYIFCYREKYSTCITFD